MTLASSVSGFPLERKIRTKDYDLIYLVAFDSLPLTINMTDGTLSDDKVLEKLDQIIKLLTPAPAPPPAKGMRKEFVNFLEQYKVLGLAVAFILGLYLGAVVQSLVKDLIMPVIGLVAPGLGNLATYSTTFRSQIFGLGDFAVAVITFIIVALVIFIIVKIATRYGLNK